VAPALATASLSRRSGIDVFTRTLLPYVCYPYTQRVGTHARGDGSWVLPAVVTVCLRLGGARGKSVARMLHEGLWLSAQ